MIELGQVDGKVTIAIKARPSAKKNAILGEHDGALKVAVTAPPEKGKANAAIAKLLAKEFGLKGNCVQLLRGATSSEKVFCVEGIVKEQLAEQLQKLLGSVDE